MVKRTIEELNLMDDFLFQEAVADEEYGTEFCKLLLETILNRTVNVVKVKVQNPITAGEPDKRGIRLDVYLEEEGFQEGEAQQKGDIYDLEVQKEDTQELPQRTRYYQALIDSRLLKAGIPYKNLKNVWIIMITPKDLFGRNRMCYTFENRCIEESDLSLQDGARKVFLYSKGEVGSREELKELLRYIEDTREENAVNHTTKKIHEIVNNVKHKEEVGVRYMKAIEYEDMIRERAQREGMEQGLEQGREQGREQGLEQGLEQGIRALISDNLESEISEENIIVKLQKFFNLGHDEAKKYFDQYSHL